ncbi:MAG: hypothetical protein ABR915_03170 [Thermoguttaceae bacterium]|jgi:hypothetical protein
MESEQLKIRFQGILPAGIRILDLIEEVEAGMWLYQAADSRAGVTLDRAVRFISLDGVDWGDKLRERLGQLMLRPFPHVIRPPEADFDAEGRLAWVLTDRYSSCERRTVERMIKNADSLQVTFERANPPRDESERIKVEQAWKDVLAEIDRGKSPRDAMEDLRQQVTDALGAVALRPSIELLIEQARNNDVQQQAGANEAKRAFKEAISKIDSTKTAKHHLADLREEAFRGLESLPPETPAMIFVRKRDPQKPADDKVAPAILTNDYPVGRRIQSVAITEIRGVGSNEAWIFKTDAKFCYQYKVAVDTEVTKNDGEQLEFKQVLTQVRQERADCGNSTVELRDLPPVFKQVFNIFEKLILDDVPGYRKIRNIADAVQRVDPRLQRTLTRGEELLEDWGVLKKDWDKVEFAEQIEKLQGATVRLVYHPGWGVETVEVLDAKHNDWLSQTDLERLAYGSSLLMDHYVFPAREKQVNDSWEVDARHAADLFRLYDVKVNGSIRVTRKQDVQWEGDPVAVLELTGGEVLVSGEVGVRKEATLRPKPGGTIHYFLPAAGGASHGKQWPFIRHASVEWDANAQWFTTNHLLFGTVRIWDLHMTSQYWARRVDKDKPPESKQ